MPTFYLAPPTLVVSNKLGEKLGEIALLGDRRPVLCDGTLCDRYCATLCLQTRAAVPNQVTPKTPNSPSRYTIYMCVVGVSFRNHSNAYH